MKAWIKKNSSFLLITGLIGLYVLSVLINLGFLNLRVEEARRAIVSLEMMQSGNYIQPHTLGWEYYNKPPAFNWVLAAFIRITGSDSEFLLRLPSFICLLIIGIFHYLISRRYLTKTVAALSVFFTLTSADLYFYTLSNGAEIDVFYSLIVYLQAVSMFWFYEKKKYILLFLASWALCATGFLTKGYPSLIFQGLTLIALSVHARSWKILFKPQHLAGIIFFLLLTGCYYYVYSYYNNPSIPLVNLLKESLQKSAVGSETTGRMHKVFTYPLVLFRVLAPWCLLLLVLFKKQKFYIWNNSFVRFSVLFILLNIGVYWITGAQKTRYIIMFVPFIMTVISYVYWQAEKHAPEKMDKFIKYAGLLFCLALVGLLALPFFVDVNWWKISLFTGLLLVFLIIFFRVRQYRIWLFITGFILIRLIYAVIGLPVKGEKEFNYRELAKGVALKTNYQPVYYWDKPDTLNMNVVVGDTLLKWKDRPVETLPYYIRYQVPYYFYRITGSLVKFDTAMKTGKTYVSYNPYERNNKIEPIDSFYDKHLNKYLIMFRPKTKSQ
ncbi:MAG TPA: glycosyltransferase family 39 protein [Chitinophagaceae bacterium]|nr:glycosyltransferase family 39 protein [Chitinophagaceae bacterium]